MRRLENADFTTDVSVDKGEGLINVEALDEQGNYRNFLNLQAIVASPKGERQTVRLEQTGPGHYEARFPTKEVGAYLLNLMDIKDGQVRGSQVVGASVNYSPEFNTSEPNLNLLRRIAESGGGKMLDPTVPAVNPFLHDRQKTFQPRDLWESLLKFAIILFTAGRGRAAHPDRPRRMAAGHAGPAALALLLARRAPTAGGRGIPGRAAGAPPASPLAANRPRRRAQARAVPPRTGAVTAALARRRSRRRPVASQPPPPAEPPKPPERARPQHHQPPARSQTPRPETQVVGALSRRQSPVA